MKYVVINCWEREIYKVGEADTPNEATEIMKADFMNEFFNLTFDVFKEHNNACHFKSAGCRTRTSTNKH